MRMGGWIRRGWISCVFLGRPNFLSRGPQTLIQIKAGGPGSVRLRLEMERFKRFRFSVLAVPLQKGFFCISVQFNRKGRFRFRFRFLENGSGVSGSAFGFGKNGSDGSGFRFRFGSWATLLRVLRHLWTDNRGAPKTQNVNHDGSNPPILGPLRRDI